MKMIPIDVWSQPLERNEMVISQTCDRQFIKLGACTAHGCISRCLCRRVLTVCSIEPECMGCYRLQGGWWTP